MTMARTIGFGQLYVALRVPSNLTAAEGGALRRALRRPGFLPALERAVREITRRYPSLRQVRVTISR
jgi:hypothetical protein